MFAALAHSSSDDVAATARTYEKERRRREYHARVQQESARSTADAARRLVAAVHIARCARGMLVRSAPRLVRLVAESEPECQKTALRAVVEAAIVEQAKTPWRASALEREPPARAVPMPVPRPRPEPPMVLTKNPAAYTKLCINGPDCPRAGISCTFAHSLAQLRQRPDGPARPIKPPKQDPRAAVAPGPSPPAPPPAPSAAISIVLEEPPPKASRSKARYDPGLVDCRYGAACKASWCHFRHPERAAPPTVVECAPCKPPPTASSAESDDRRTVERLCVVCMDKDRAYALIPCGHHCVCRDCFDHILGCETPRCPLCNADLQAAGGLSVYL